MTKFIKNIFIGSFLLMGFLFSACSKDDQNSVDPTKGQVKFHFVKNTVYLLDELAQISTVKITLENEGDSKVLPSLELAGDESMISTKLVSLIPGTYKISSYKAFNAKGALILESEPEKDNTFQIAAGENVDFRMPVDIKVIVTNNNVRNFLYALATDVLGEDRSKWPPSWNEENDMDTWEGLIYDYDDYGNFTYLVGLIIDGEGYTDIEFDNKLTPIKRGLPEFKNMKKLSPAIVNLASVESLIIRNCDLEELPSNMNESNIGSLLIENTALKELPESMAGMLNLKQIFLKGNQLTQFPSQLCQIKNLRSINVIDENISSLPEELGNLSDLVNLRINNTKIESIPDIFTKVKISSLDVSDNKNLSSLPSSVGLSVNEETNSKTTLHGLILDGCGFTSIPSQVVRPGIKTLSMKNNKISSINASDIQAMTDLESLILDGNTFPSFPVINHNNLIMLSLIDCGLTRDQIDITHIPNILANNGKNLFLTKEEFTAVNGGILNK